MSALSGPMLVADAFSVREQVVIVTGAAGRIGRVIAHAFAANGARVVASDRQVDRLEEAAANVRAETGAEVMPHVAELAEPAALRGLVDAAEAKFGRLDTIVNCGAIPQSRPLSVETDEHFDTMFHTNVRPLFLLAKYALPLLEKSRGSVVTISSINGHRALFPCPLYSATKAAVIRMTETLAAEVGEKRVRFNSVSPGLITEGGGYMNELAGKLHPPYGEQFVEAFRPEVEAHLRASQPLPDFGTGYDIAMACLYLASPAARFITGTDLLVDGGKFHMFDEQIRRGPSPNIWGRVREFLNALPDEAWNEPKPEWLSRPRKGK